MGCLGSNALHGNVEITLDSSLAAKVSDSAVDGYEAERLAAGIERLLGAVNSGNG